MNFHWHVTSSVVTLLSKQTLLLPYFTQKNNVIRIFTRWNLCYTNYEIGDWIICAIYWKFRAKMPKQKLQEMQYHWLPHIYECLFITNTNARHSDYSDYPHKSSLRVPQHRTFVERKKHKNNDHQISNIWTLRGENPRNFSTSGRTVRGSSTWCVWSSR